MKGLRAFWLPPKAVTTMSEELSDGERMANAAHLISQARGHIESCSGEIPEGIADVLSTAEEVSREYGAIERIRNLDEEDFEGIRQAVTDRGNDE